MPLFRRYGADLVFSGHDHLYERQSWNGIPYIVTGGGGAPLYDAGRSDSTKYAESVLHYCRVEICDSTARVWMVRCGGTTGDSLEIRKPKKLF